MILALKVRPQIRTPIFSDDWLNGLKENKQASRISGENFASPQMNGVEKGDGDLKKPQISVCLPAELSRGAERIMKKKQNVFFPVFL